MPINTLNNNIFRVKDLRVDYDKTGHFLCMNPGHAAACVICISRRGPVKREELSLSEDDLRALFAGTRLDFPEKGYILQGITKQQLSAAAQYRNFTLEPPAYVHAWGMANTNNEGTVLYVPENCEEQCVLVPVLYKVERSDAGFTLWLQRTQGYQDGDLMYQVDNHKPIPIPVSGVNREIPMRPGVRAEVILAPEVDKKYILK